MRISVIVPCHNAERWIATALQSVRDQTYLPHELIVIDDGSIDGSIKQIKASGVTVRLLQSEWGNAAGTRNVGIEAATGNWIALLDADDFWYPNHLARAVSILEKSNDVAFMSNHDWIDLEGKVIPMPAHFQERISQPTSGFSAESFIEHLVKGFHFGHSTVLYERNRLIEVGCFDPAQKRRHDLDLWLRMIFGRSWSYDSQPSAGYREGTPGSISKEVVSCEYYYLRSLLKNSERFRSNAMQSIIHVSARRAVGLAFVDGQWRDYEMARSLAWPYLKPSYRLYYRCASECPSPFRALMRWRRRVVMGADGSGH